jgi:diguanylate cyclase (GGDEF)-like protein
MLMADRSSRAVALIHLDIDRFGDLNAAYGQDAGDRLLIAAGGRLRDCLRRSDTVARLGADEFAVLLPELNRGDDARQVTDKLAGEIEALAGTEGLPAALGCCIGSAVYPRDAADVDQFLMAAALALNAAKAGGRGRIAAYERSMADRLTARIDMQRDLEEALDRKEFSLVFQPQVALADGRVVGAEALLRWRSPTRGPVSPAAFIPVAEHSGLIVAIGRWVIDETCRQIAEWRTRGLTGLRVAVNISPVQLGAGGLARGVAESLERWGVPATALEFELTESVLLTRSPEIVAELETLHRMGVGWAVDDFGTGYASLDYLRRFPIDRLKIDRSFVDGLLGNASDGAIVRSIIGLGLSLGLYVVAEGVETADQVAALHQLGCDAIQGYVFSRPLPPDQLPTKLMETLAGPAA